MDQEKTKTKEFSKAWFKTIVNKAYESARQDPGNTLGELLDDLRRYIAHLDEIDSHRGAKGTCSEKKRASNVENGKKGGWPKGKPRKNVQDE